MSTPGASDGVEFPSDSSGTDSVDHARHGGSGRWRRLLIGRGDEFSEHVAPLSTAQRENLVRATDELMRRYSISHSVGSTGSEGHAEGDQVSADEFGAALETILAETFDFGWFDRPDLPEAPELAFESSEGDQSRSVAVEDEGIHAQEPLTWSDEEIQVTASEDLDASDSWREALGGDRAAEPEPESELILEAEPEPESELILEVEPEPESELIREVEPPPEPEPEPQPQAVSEGDVSHEIVVAEREVAELEEVLREAVAAEREALLFASAMRQRVAEAKESLATLRTR